MVPLVSAWGLRPLLERSIPMIRCAGKKKKRKRGCVISCEVKQASKPFDRSDSAEAFLWSTTF